MKYSIVSYLDQSSTDEIQRLQEVMSEVTGSKACLSSWEPHVTLGDGVTINEAELKSVGANLSEIAEQTQPIQIDLSGFGSTDGWSGGEEQATPYVIWVNVTTSQLLNKTASVIKQRVTDSCQIWYKMPFPYRPHVTIAFRDLDKSGYRAGLKYLEGKSIELDAALDHVSLVQKLDSRDVEHKRFLFSK